MADEAASTLAAPYLEVRGRLEFKASQSATPQLLDRLRVSLSGDQKPQLVFSGAENRTPGDLPATKSPPSDVGDAGPTLSPINLASDTWGFTGGSRIQFCDDGEDLQYDVPVSSVNVRAGKTGGTRVVELFATLPPVGTSEGAVVISTTIPRSLKDVAEFHKCCMQLAQGSLCDDFKKCDPQFRAVLKSIGVSVAGGKVVGSNATVSLAPRGVRWVFGKQAGQNPFSVPVAIIHEVFAQSTRLKRCGSGAVDDTLGIVLDPDENAILDTQAKRFWVVVTATWPGDKDSAFDDPPEVTVEVAWDPPSPVLVFDDPPKSPANSLSGLLRAANAQAAMSRAALENAVGRQPESFLPRFEKVEWCGAKPAVLFYKQRCRMSAEGVISIPESDPGMRAVVSMVSGSSFASGSPRRPVATLSLPGLGFAGSFAVELDHDPSCLDAATDTGAAVASFRLLPKPLDNSVAKSARTWSTRLGALALDSSPGGGLATDPVNGSSMSRLVITRPRDGDGDPPDPGRPVGVEWHLRLALDRATPEGVDRPWGDRQDRRPPVVVPQVRKASSGTPAPGASGQLQPPFVLVVTESAARGHDRWLRVQLLDSTDDHIADNEVSTLLSLEPWSVLRFTRRRLERLGDAENATVAIFDSDDRTWRFKQAIPEYAFQFPVQGIGESADKPGILEIHDLSRFTGSFPKLQEAIRPGGAEHPEIQVLRPVPDAADDPIERRFVLETRFAPSLDLWVKPSDLDRNYILPEWQAHEIFRRRNDFGLGVALRALRGEFLYGLSVGVDATRESGPAGMARVAEIEALAGKLPPLLLRPSPSPYQAPLLRRWRLLRRALLRRSERIEIWTPAYDQIRPFVYARFEKGATFALRSTALHRHPLERANKHGEDSSERPIRLESHGLPGGALWPLESSSVLDDLVNQPASWGGTIERIAISPGGGDADQSAGFLNDQVTIASQTRAGFLQRQRIEILGRISVFWHRAKHVIIYERTVNPSEQFAPLADADGWHKSRSRRAVVRKVSEYIEILQPTRSYPDIGPEDDTASGFLDSVRFNTRIIHIDGAWKTEIPKQDDRPAGYKIPLWNAGAAAQRPNVYPLPSVAAVTLGEGKEERPLVPRQIANPENLYFYTQLAGPTGSVPAKPCDPDSWDPVFGIDFGNLVDPAKLERLVAPGGDGYGTAPTDSTGSGTDRFAEGRKPPTPRVLPGHHRFTWRLLPDGKRTAVNAGFGDKPVYGDLESITFSRGMADALSDDLRLKASISPGQLHELVSQKKEDFVAFLKGNRKILLEVSRTCASLYSNPLCDALNALLPDALAKKKRLLQTIFQDWSRQAELWTEKEIGDAIESAASSVRLAVSRLLNVRDVVSDLLGEAETGVGAIRNDIASLRIAVTEYFVALRTTVQRSIGRIALLLDAANRDLASTGALTTRLFDDTKEKLIAEIAALEQQIDAEKEEVLQRFAASTSPLAALLVKALADKLEAFVPKASDKSLQVLRDELKQLPSGGGLPSLAKLQSQLLEIEKTIRELEQAILAMLDAPNQQLGELMDTADGTLGGLLNASRNAVAKYVEDEAMLGFLNGLTDPIEIRNKVQSEFRQVSADIDGWVSRAIADKTNDVTKALKAACTKAEDWFQDIAQIGEGFKKAAEDVTTVLEDTTKSAEEVKQELKKLADAAKNSPAVIAAYRARVSDALADLGPGVPKPGKVLALVSAATQAPEIGQMQANIDRMRCSYKQGQIATSKAMASFSKLGNALKALGIELPFDGLGDQLELSDTSFKEVVGKFDLQRLLPDFGGIKLDKLLDGVKLPETPQEFRDAVKLRHDFDKVHFRAWAQIDVNMPIKDRKKLFGIGPMVMYFRDSLLTGTVRAEASKDTADVSTTGSGLIETNIDVDVSGELIVSLEQVRIEYSKEKKLHVNFDPKRIKLHSAMQFVQDTFGDLLGDQIGGLTIVKERGLPVGVEHLFKLPVMSLMAGTSGISNIQMSNGFRLMAYPDFVISNRFCLSKPELPFLFTFFILGGTGYVIVDARYRPMDEVLTVEVEAAIGGAAALGIASGPITGQVFITLSVALTYRKTFISGQASGDGLSVAAVLVVAGNVNIAGIVDVYIGVVLRMTYREGGAIDGVGTVTVEVKISVFFTFKFRSEMTLKMRGGRAETTKKIETSGKPRPAVERLRKQVDDYKSKAEQLQKTRV